MEGYLKDIYQEIKKTNELLEELVESIKPKKRGRPKKNAESEKE